MLIDNKIHDYPTFMDCTKLVCLMLISAVICVLFFEFVFLIFATMSGLEFDHYTNLSNQMADVASSLIVLLWIRADLTNNAQKQLHVGFRRWRLRHKAVLIVVMCWLFLHYGFYGIVDINFPDLDFSSLDSTPPSTESSPFIFLTWRLVDLVAICVIAPIIEELVFRGYLQSVLVRKYSAPIGIITTALLFSAFHWSPELDSIALFVRLLFIFLVGLCYGILFHFSKSLWPPIVLHAINNMLAVTTEALDF